MLIPGNCVLNMEFEDGGIQVLDEGGDEKYQQLDTRMMTDERSR